MTTDDRAILEQIALRVLDDDPDAPVRVRLSRDVLTSSGPVAAERPLVDSRWVRLLATTQRSDGGWGRFHSADASVHQAIPTTEFAVRRALALGLAPSSRILSAAADHLRAVLSGVVLFPDPPERNERWPVGVELFAAATLARVVPDDPLLARPRERWAGVVVRAFRSGSYDLAGEQAGQLEHLGVEGAHTHLGLANRYVVELLSSGGALHPTFSRRYATWVWHRPGGVGYLSTSLGGPPPPTASAVDRWLTSIELLSRYPGFHHDGRHALDWLRRRQTAEGWWDLGRRPSRSEVYPLSDHWRGRRRLHDHTTRVLVLLDRGLRSEGLKV